MKIINQSPQKNSRLDHHGKLVAGIGDREGMLARLQIRAVRVEMFELAAFLGGVSLRLYSSVHLTP